MRQNSAARRPKPRQPPRSRPAPMSSRSRSAHMQPAATAPLVRFGCLKVQDAARVREILQTRPLLLQFDWELERTPVQRPLWKDAIEVCAVSQPCAEKKAASPCESVCAEDVSFERFMQDASCLRVPLPRGMINRGNTCFINAVLQPLLMLPAFFGIFETLQPALGTMHEASKDFPLIGAFCELSTRFRTVPQQSLPAEMMMRFPFDDCLVPDALYDALKRKSRIPRYTGEQEDSHEFLAHLLSELHEEMCELQQRYTHLFADAFHTVTGDGREKRRRSCPVSRLFCGEMRSTVRVTQPPRESVTVEPFFFVQLDVENVEDVVTALRHVSAPEQVAYAVSSVALSATKTLTLERPLPPLLCLHLKTFVFDVRLEDTLKIDRFIAYPSAFVVPRCVLHSAASSFAAEDAVYRLVAVVYHHGRGASDGHYTCDLLIGRAALDCRWMRVDDDVLHDVSEFDVLRPKHDQSAYILFYEAVLDAVEARRLLEAADRHSDALAHVSSTAGDSSSKQAPWNSANRSVRPSRRN